MRIEFVIDHMSIKRRERLFAKAQDYIDKKCIERMEPYVPVADSRLKNSGRLLSSAGIAEPGHLVFTAPKAKVSYYAKVDHRHGENPRATRLWFRTMKAESAREILRGAAAIVGGRAVI